MFKVERKEAENFSKIWNKSGISIILNNEAIDFATDFANVVLNNFIRMCAEDAKKREAEAPKSKIIMEGIQ